MINEILRLENLITADTDEIFVHSDTKKISDIVVTAAIMKTDIIYLITESQAHYPPIVCKIDREFKNSKFVYISPSLRFLVWINNESKYMILSISKLLEFVQPKGIPGIRIDPNFAFSVLGFSELNMYSYLSADINGHLSFNVLKAEWWEPCDTKSFIVFVEKNGLHFLNVNHPESQLKFFPINDIICALFSRKKNSILVTIVSNNLTQVFCFSYILTDIIMETKSLLIPINYSRPFSIQNSVNQANWEYYILQEHLRFYTKNQKLIKITEFDTNSKDSTSIIVTKHFIFYCNKNKVYARFIQPKHEPIVILDQSAEIHLISFEDDEVSLSSDISIVHVSLKKDQIDSIFARLVFDNNLDDAIFVGQGLSLSIPYLFQYIINEYVKQRNLSGAFKIMEHEKCDLRDTLLRFLQSGLDRLALHVALHSYNKSPMFQKAVPLFADRVIIKNKAFYSFTKRMNQIFDKSDYLQPPDVFSRSTLIENFRNNDPKLISKIPKALVFRYNIFFGIENDDISILKCASKLDLPIYPIFSFSAHFKSLLNQLRSMLDTLEEEIGIDLICSSLAFYQDTKIYLSNKKLYLDDQLLNIPFNVTSFNLKGKILYVTDQLLNVYKTELPRIDFIELSDIHPTVKIEANDDNVVFLSLSGSIFFESGDYITGEFVDIAIGRNRVFAIDRNGELFSISLIDREISKIPMKHFVHAICAVDDIPISIVSKNCCIINSKEYEINFEFCRGGTEEAVIGGEGMLYIINKWLDVEKKEYSQRIGNLLYVCKSDNSFYVVGSACVPIKLLNNPTPSMEMPSLSELRLISSKYNEDFLLKIFDKEPFLTFVYTLFERWEKLPNCAGIKNLEPLINDLPPEAAPHIIHSLFFQNFPVADNMINTEYARSAFLDHPEDLKNLNKKQLLTVLPPPPQKVKGEVDNFSIKLMQRSVHQAIVPSLRFKEGKLFVFNCNHILNTNEMLQSVTNIKNYLNARKLPNTGQFVFDTYLLTHIPAQCPKCLLQRIEAYFRAQ